VAERSVVEVPGRTPAVAHTTITVTIRYFAAARAAAGVPEEQLSVPTDVPTEVSTDVSTRCGSGQRSSSDLPATDHGARVGHRTVGDLLDAAADRHGSGLATVLARCSFLLDEVAVHGRQTPVLDGQVLDVLPPFAGG